MDFGLGQIFGALLGGVFSLFGNIINATSVENTNEYNAQNVAATNATNLQAVRETNETNTRNAETAYRRSLPENQVRDLMSAGFSRSGALAKIAGGGVYTPPALATASAQAHQKMPQNFDFSGVAQAFERLSGVPSNVVQHEIMQQQLKDLKQEAEIRQKEEMRKEEMHQLDLWQKHYGKSTAELLDAFSSKVVTAAAEKNYDLSQAKSSQQIIRDLGLDSDSDYKKMPHLARTQLFDAIKSQNDQRMSQEVHQENIIKARLEQSIQEHNLMQLKEDYQNSVKEHKTQDKERAVREGRAAFESVLLDNNINQEEFLKSIRFDKDGKPNLVNKTKVQFKEAWSLIGSILPVDYLADILRGLLAFSPK